MSDRQTKQLVITGHTSKAEWTRDDTARAVAQGSGLFTAKGSKVMRVQRIDGEPGPRHQSQSTLGFRQ